MVALRERAGLWSGILLILLLCLAPRATKAQDTTLHVGVQEVAPFIMAGDEEWTGFTIDLWREIARRAEVDYEFEPFDAMTDLIDAVESGDVDVGLGAISISTDLEERIDFSYPYFDSGVQIMTRQGDVRSLMALLFSDFALTLLRIIGVFLLVLLAVAHVIWLVERRNNPDFPKTYLRGIWDSLWWSTVTVTTVGYGDLTPRSTGGRIVGLVWMLAGLFIVAYFTAQVTAAFTLEGLQGNVTQLADLQGKRIWSVEGSTAEEYLIDRGVSFRTAPDIDSAFQRLVDSDIDAIVYDAPVLLHLAATDEGDRVQVVGALLAQETYGIALPPDSPWRESINRALLAMRSDGTYAALSQKWFGSS